MLVFFMRNVDVRDDLRCLHVPPRRSPKPVGPGISGQKPFGASRGGGIGLEPPPSKVNSRACWALCLPREPECALGVAHGRAGSRSLRLLRAAPLRGPSQESSDRVFARSPLGTRGEPRTDDPHLISPLDERFDLQGPTSSSSSRILCSGSASGPWRRSRCCARPSTHARTGLG